MNSTHLEHIIYALAMLAMIGLPTKNWWAGAAFAAAFFIGREHAQREYKIGDPSKLMPWEGFDVWNWSLDAQLDLLAPVLVVLVVAFLMSRR